MSRFMGYAILSAMIVVAILLCLDIAYLLRGSLEEFSTPDQEEKVRVVTRPRSSPSC